MITEARQSFSKYVIIFCAVIMAYGSFVFYPRWNKPATESNIAWDVEGYYWYLPSFFIFKDLKKQQFKDTILTKYKASAQNVFQHAFIHPPSGHYVMKYTSGMALIYLPAFTAGHVAAHVLHYPKDGFSAPYKLALQIWGLVFALTGLVYLRKLLKRYYTDTITGIVLLLLVLGTNYFNYTSIDGAMPHSWLFTIYVFILLQTCYFYQTGKARYALATGLLIGLATLIRPSEIIALLIPALWGLDSVSDIKARLRLFFQRKWLLVTVAACVFAVVSIQLVYWKYVAGEWLVYSYQDQGFSFFHPHIFDYSFSMKAGWLRYCPMMILAWVGLLPFLRYGKNRFAVILYFMISFYIVSAWNVWDYGGFSGRAMIQSYPVLLFPIATLLTYAAQQKLIKSILIPVIGLCLYINIWWTYQAHIGGLVDPLCTTKAYYWKMVGRWSLPEDIQKLKDTDELPETEPAVKTLILEDELSDTSAYCISTANPATIPMQVPAKALKQQWIRVAADFHCISKEWNVWLMPELVVKFIRNNQEAKVRFLRLHRFLADGQTRNIFLDIKVPDFPFERVDISAYNAGSNTQTCMQHLKVWSFNL